MLPGMLKQQLPGIPSGMLADAACIAVGMEGAVHWVLYNWYASRTAMLYCLLLLSNELACCCCIWVLSYHLTGICSCKVLAWCRVCLVQAIGQEEDSVLESRSVSASCSLSCQASFLLIRQRFGQIPPSNASQ